MNTAAYLHGAYDLRIDSIPAAAAGNDQILVDIESVGICGSDLHYYKDGGIGAATIREPFVPGHEFSARLTDDLPERGLTRGTLVAIDPALPCHACEWCARSYHNLCPQVRFIGAPPYNGALTQRLAVPRSSVIALPESMTGDEGAMLEPLGVCIHAVDLARPALLESVAVLGCGGIGLGIIQLLTLAGVGRIIAVDPQAHRRERASRLGASDTLTRADDIAEATNGRGVDRVIEATNSPNGFVDAVSAARIGARIVLVGIPDGDTYTALSASDARRKGLDIRFSRRMGDVYPRAIDLVTQRRVDVDALVSHRVDIDATAEAFESQANEADGLIKTLVYPNGRSAAT